MESPLPSDLPDSIINSKIENVAVDQVPPKLDIPEPVKKSSDEDMPPKSRPDSSSKKVTSDTKAEVVIKKGTSNARQLGKLKFYSFISLKKNFIRKLID